MTANIENHSESLNSEMNIQIKNDSNTLQHNQNEVF
jgi:hypothetical protein